MFTAIDRKLQQEVNVEATAIAKGISVSQASFRGKAFSAVGFLITVTFFGLVIKNQIWPFLRAKLYKPVL